MAIVKMNKFTLLTFESKKSYFKDYKDFKCRIYKSQIKNLLEANEYLKSLSKDEVDSNIAKYEKFIKG